MFSFSHQYSRTGILSTIMCLDIPALYSIILCQGTTATTTADGEDLTSFRRLREEQDKEFADALAIDEAKVCILQ